MTNNQMMDNRLKTGHGWCCNYVSWTAIFSGAFVALGLSFLLYTFGTALGLTAFSFSSDNAMTVAVGGFIAMLVGGVLAMFFSGWVAGFLNRQYCEDSRVGALSGFIAWCLSLVLGAILAAQFGQLLTLNYQASPTAKTAVSRYTPNIYGQILPEGRTAEHTAPAGKATPSDEKAINNAGKAMFLTFLLFIAGAISSAIGGYCGMMGCHYDKDDRIKDRDRNRNV